MLLFAEIILRRRWTHEYETLVELQGHGKNEVLGEKTVPVPLSSPQIPHALAWDQIRAPQWQVGDYPPEIWYGVLFGNFGCNSWWEERTLSSQDALCSIKLDPKNWNKRTWGGRGRQKKNHVSAKHICTICASKDIDNKEPDVDDTCFNLNEQMKYIWVFAVLRQTP